MEMVPTAGAQPGRSYFQALDRLSIDTAGVGDVVGLSVVTLAWFVGNLLMFAADRTDHVVPAIFPTDTSFPVDHFPGTVG